MLEKEQVSEERTHEVQVNRGVYNFLGINFSANGFYTADKIPQQCELAVRTADKSLLYMFTLPTPNSDKVYNSFEYLTQGRRDVQTVSVNISEEAYQYAEMAKTKIREELNLDVTLGQVIEGVACTSAVAMGCLGCSDLLSKCVLVCMYDNEEGQPIVEMFFGVNTLVGSSVVQKLIHTSQAIETGSDWIKPLYQYSGLQRTETLVAEPSDQFDLYVEDMSNLYSVYGKVPCPGKAN